MKQIVVDGVLTAYFVVRPKAKKTILVLHGWGHSSKHWMGIAESLDSSYRVVGLDLPGFGGTAHLPDIANVPDYVKFVESFMEKLDIKKAWFLGHSFGGQISTYLSIHNLELVEGMILVSPAIVRLKSVKDKIKIFIFKKFGLIKKLFPRSWVEFVLSKVTATDYYGSSDKHREILKKITHFEQSNVLNKVLCPALLLWGDQDKAIAYKAKYVVEKIPKCELKVLYGQGHNVHIFKPEMIVDEIDRYLRRQ